MNGKNFCCGSLVLIGAFFSINAMAAPTQPKEPNISSTITTVKGDDGKDIKYLTVTNGEHTRVGALPAPPPPPPKKVPKMSAESLDAEMAAAPIKPEKDINTLLKESKASAETIEMFMLLNTENDKIKEMQKNVEDKQRAISSPQYVPKSVISSVSAYVEPGSTPPSVRIFLDRPTSIVVNDITGTPWPIVNFEVGSSPDKMTVARLDGGQGSVLSIVPKEPFFNTVIILQLKDLITPVALELVSGQKEYDVRTDVRVMSKGPNTQLIGVGLPGNVNPELFAVLYGAPENVKQLKVDSPYAQAWLTKNNKMYLRTRMKVTSPAFEHVTSSPDGTFAYQLPITPIVSYKNNGQFNEFHIDGF